MISRALILLSCTALAACGTTSSTSSTSVAPADARPSSDAAGAGPSDARDPRGDGSLTREPPQHRATETACPQTRPAGGPACRGATTNACSVDSDCTAGDNGRCYASYGGIGCLANLCS